MINQEEITMLTKKLELKHYGDGEAGYDENKWN